ncbi:MAG: GGDEF domain-containing protein [Thermoanaerobaculaceae bacterium]|nr:GGDEF domain-containing protein [Thermoanaerobaculaceae bacterium]
MIGLALLSAVLLLLPQARASTAGDLERLEAVAEREPALARELARELLKGEHEPLELARIYNALAMASYMANDFKGAIDAARKAEEIASQNRFRDQLAYAFYHQGSALWRTGDYSSGYELCTEALGIFEETGNRRGQLYAANRASTILAELNYFSKALEFNETALKLAQRVGDTALYARMLSNRAYIHYRRAEYPEMLRHALRSIESYEQVPEDPMVRNPLVNAGVAYLELGQYEQAVAYLERSLPISQRVQDRLTELIAWKFLARTHRNLKAYSRALEEAFTALEIARQIKSLFEMKNVNLEIAAIYSNLGDPRAGYRYLAEALRLSEELQRGEINESIARTLKKYEVEQREREIRFLQQEKTIAELRLQQQRSVRNLLLLLAASLACGVGITLRAYVVRRRAHRIIASKNVELRTIDRIVQEINRQKELDSLIDAIYRHTLTLLPQTQKGGFLFYIEEEDRFRPVVLYHYSRQEVKGIEFTPQEARQRYREGSEAVAGGIYLLHDPHLSFGAERLREVIELPRVILTLELEVDGRTMGYLLFENMDDPNAFSDEDVERLVRIREHLTSALAKTYYIAKLEQASRSDPLTKLLNRRGMMERLQQEVDRFERYQHPFCVAIGDLDDFKKVNDTFGHEAGDCALVTVAEVFRSRLRKVDQVGRWGGEEFLALLPSTTEGRALIALEKVRQGIRQTPARCEGAEIELSMTFGVSQFMAGQTLDECLMAADRALYLGKTSGKNRVVAFSGLGERGGAAVEQV